jgi:Tfp pilus assembly protein PilF
VALELRTRRLLDEGPIQKARETAEGVVAAERSRLAAAYRLLAAVALRQGRGKDADEALLKAMDLEPPGITIHPLDPRKMPPDRFDDLPR